MQRLCQQHGGAGVAVQVLVQGRKAEAGGAVLLKGGGVVDHRIDPPHARGHGRQQAAHRGLVAQVRLEKPPRRRPAWRSRRRFCHRLGFGVAVVHRHLPAAGRQRQRDLAPQPPRGAGHEDHGLEMTEQGSWAGVEAQKEGKKGGGARDEEAVGIADNGRW
jgi:hypothetical protein